ncbi:START domain-containing protein [Besnoitia besnoiti]|uniref:Phosphatidylcholine transfer protein n=1 Tax=Besnoitia besnoiti TaxID=94643 RepID=A0A2A9ML01_BESBE|nr:START domain-containing protein [Besnoitia besnoiti]PFH38685.1 START domain-containing protein [Besnoitia besnoiti]
MTSPTSAPPHSGQASPATTGESTAHKSAPPLEIQLPLQRRGVSLSNCLPSDGREEAPVSAPASAPAAAPAAVSPERLQAGTKSESSDPQRAGHSKSSPAGKRGNRSSVDDAALAAALLQGVVDDIDAVPKGYITYWNDRVDEEQVEALGESEEFERLYMEQQAKQLPFRTSTTEWTVNTAAGAMVCVMAWGPIMMVLCFVVGGALGFGFAIAHDLWQMRKKQTAATKQKQKLDQLMRWADFHFRSSQNQLQLIFKVILEYQVLARLGAFSKTARSQLKLLYAFLSRDDVGRCLWLYLDFFEDHFRIMTRSEIAMCSLVCTVSVECCKSLRKKKPPPVVLRMMQMVEAPAVQRIFDTGKNAAAFAVTQDQKLKEMDAIMYADAAKQVQRHILRGGELLDPLHSTPAAAPAESEEETEEDHSDFFDHETDSLMDHLFLGPSAAAAGGAGGVTPPPAEGAEFVPPGRGAQVPASVVSPHSEPAEDTEGIRRASTGAAQSPALASEATLLGPLKPIDNFNVALSLTPADPLASAALAPAVGGAGGSERAPHASTGAGFSRRTSKLVRPAGAVPPAGPEPPAAGAVPAGAVSQRGSFYSDADEDQSPRARGKSRPSVAHRDSKKLDAAGPPRLFKSYQDLVDFDVNLKHQTPIGLYEFDFLDEKMAQDVNDPSWELTVDQKGIRVYKYIAPNSPVVLVKAYAELEGIPMPVLCHEIRDIQMRLQWDSTFEDYRIIESNVNHNEIIYCLMKAPFPVSNRDFLQWRRTEVDLEAGVVKMLMRSASHPSVPERPGVVRAETILSGYVMQARGPNSSSVFILAQTDVKGLIPKWVVNTTAARAPVGWVENLRKACLKFMKEHGTEVPASSLVSS